MRQAPTQAAIQAALSVLKARKLTVDAAIEKLELHARRAERLAELVPLDDLRAYLRLARAGPPAEPPRAAA
jgi:hypothetical protein